VDQLTFISEIVKSLTWPVTVIVIIVVLRKDISQLILNIKRFKHKGTEIDFERSVREIKEEVGGTHQESDVAVEPDDLAILSPRGSVIESWLRIEEALMGYNQRNGIYSESKKAQGGVARGILQILDQDVLSKSSIHALSELRKLRNEAVHMNDSNISTSAANEYRLMSNKLVSEIENA
jgi:hypothetical protein